VANRNTGRDRKTKKTAGPPKPNRTQQKAAIRQTSRGQRVEPPGARAGGGGGQGGPTPDAKVRQRVLNRGADARRNQREGGRGGGGGGGFTGGSFSGGGQRGGGMSNTPPEEVAGPPRRPRPVGTPPGQAAPPRTPSTEQAAPGGQVMPGSEEFRALSRPEQIEIERSMGGGPGSGRSNEEIVNQRRGQLSVDGGDSRVVGQAGAGDTVADATKNLENARASGDPKFIEAANNRMAAAAAAEGGAPGSGGATARGDVNAPQPAGPPKVGEERRAGPETTSPVIGTPGTPQGPPSSGDIAATPGQPMDAAGQDQVRATAAAEASSGQPVTPPGGVDAQGNFQPEPGMAPQDAANAIQAQSEGMMQQKPEPALSKSSLGADSPIEQADAGGKLRAGTRHHMRQLGFNTSGMVRPVRRVPWHGRPSCAGSADSCREA
jgi:hypothetical protein